MRIRPFSALDLPEVLSLQARSLPATGWQALDYLGLSQSAGGLLLVAEGNEYPESALAGFAASRIIGSEAELLILAVSPERRRQGVGRLLLNESIRGVFEAGASSYYLEVRPSNEAALALYYSAGFGLHSIRKGYYSQPSEDACVFSLALEPSTRKAANGEAQPDALRRAPAR